MFGKGCYTDYEEEGRESKSHAAKFLDSDILLGRKLQVTLVTIMFPFKSRQLIYSH